MKKVLLSLIAAGLAAALIYSCSKETPMVTERYDTATEEPDVSRLILNFIERMEARNEGLPFKSEEKISVDSAVWYIDATLNLTYAKANYPFSKAQWDTVYTEMPVLANKEVNISDVFDTYDATLRGLSEKYHAIEEENKQFMMAMVEDMGAVGGNKHKVRLIILTGTGILEHKGDFGEGEAYWWHKPILKDCEGEDAETNAPLLFEALLEAEFAIHPNPNCRWVNYGTPVVITYWYYDYPSGLYYPPNYMDYKVFFASSSVGPITAETKCLEHDQHNLGLHEMQYYYDNLKDFVVAYHNSPDNTDNRRFAVAYIESAPVPGTIEIIMHIPQVIYRKKLLECSAVHPIPPIW